MSTVEPGWYKDPADPATQRYWDGEGWIGHALPADAPTPPGPPPAENTAPPAAPIQPDTAAPGHPQQPTVIGHPPTPSHVPPPGQIPSPDHAPPSGHPQASGSDTPTGQPPLGSHPGGAPVSPPPPGAPPAGWPYPVYPYPYTGRQPIPRPHGLALARPGARLVARLIDIGVLALLTLVVNAFFIWQYARELAPTIDAWERYFSNPSGDVPQNSSRSGYLQIVIILVTAALWLAYEVPAVANTGQTLGKRVLGIKVVRLDDAGPVGFARSLRRWNTLGLPTLLWPCCGIGFLLQLVDVAYVAVDRPLQQALHDKSARTVVVQMGGAEPSSDAPPSAAPPGDEQNKTPGGIA